MRGSHKMHIDDFEVGMLYLNGANRIRCVVSIVKKHDCSIHYQACDLETKKINLQSMSISADGLINLRKVK